MMRIKYLGTNAVTGIWNTNLTHENLLLPTDPRQLISSQDKAYIKLEYIMKALN